MMMFKYQIIDMLSQMESKEKVLFFIFIVMAHAPRIMLILLKHLQIKVMKFVESIKEVLGKAEGKEDSLSN